MSTNNYLRISAPSGEHHLHFFDDRDQVSVSMAVAAAHGAMRRGRGVTVYRPHSRLMPGADVAGVIGLSGSGWVAMCVCAALRSSGSLSRVDLERLGLRAGQPPLGSTDPLAYIGHWIDSGLIVRNGNAYTVGPQFDHEPPDAMYPMVREAMETIALK